jgi:hypothetical protein
MIISSDIDRIDSGSLGIELEILWFYSFIGIGQLYLDRCRYRARDRVFLESLIGGSGFCIVFIPVLLIDAGCLGDLYWEELADDITVAKVTDIRDP